MQVRDPGPGRRWMVHFLSAAYVRPYLVDHADGVVDEEIQHMQVEVPLAEWPQRCAEFGLTVDGTPVSP